MSVDNGRSPSGSGSRPTDRAQEVAAVPASIPNAEDDPSVVACPNCAAPFVVNVIAAVGKDQRFSWVVYPKPHGMIQAQAIGGQLTQIDKLFKAIAREDGGKVRTYLERVSMTEDGGLQFDMAVLDVRSASGIETRQGGDPAEGRRAKHESPTGKAGDAQTEPSND